MLLDILKDIKSETGRDYLQSSQKAILTSRVNDAAKEIYESQDLEGSLDEQVFDLAVNSQLVALPWYAAYPRGWRYFDGRMSFKSNDIKNRYNDGIGDEVWVYNFRSIRYSPISRDLTNETRLTFTLASAESVEFNIKIAGSTSISERITDTITFPVGTLSVSSILTFKTPIFSIIKSIPTSYNITVTDAEANEIAFLPNHRTRSYFHIIQILDTETLPVYTTNAGVEILYKLRFNKMNELYDEFLYGDTYDKAIFWKYLEQNSKDPISAAGFQLKCNQVIDSIKSDAKIAKREKLNLPANAYFNSKMYGSKYRFNRSY